MSKPGRIRLLWQKYSLPPSIRNAIDQVLKDKLTYLPESRLVALALLCGGLAKKTIPGVIVEAGCALGGSSIILAKSKEHQRRLYVYDVFGMIPPPDSEDGDDAHSRYEVIRAGHSNGIGGDSYYGYKKDLYESVLENLCRFGCSTDDDNITLVKGDVEETLEIDDQVSLAHVDVDWYKPVRICMERIVPRLAPGGSIVFDDYFEWSGCRRAVDEYFKNCSAPGFVYDTSSGSLVVTRSDSP